jgi:hypothetical protein
VCWFLRGEKEIAPLLNSNIALSVPHGETEPTRDKLLQRLRIRRGQLLGTTSISYLKGRASHTGRDTFDKLAVPVRWIPVEHESAA